MTPHSPKCCTQAFQSTACLHGCHYALCSLIYGSVAIDCMCVCVRERQRQTDICPKSIEMLAYYKHKTQIETQNQLKIQPGFSRHQGSQTLGLGVT